MKSRQVIPDHQSAGQAVGVQAAEQRLPHVGGVVEDVGGQRRHAHQLHLGQLAAHDRVLCSRRGAVVEAAVSGSSKSGLSSAEESRQITAVPRATHPTPCRSPGSQAAGRPAAGDERGESRE
jgi:hypothetical protein